MEHELYRYRSNQDSWSTSGFSKPDNENMDNAGEPLSDNFERNIDENLKSLNSDEGVLNKITGNQSKNKNSENMKLLMEWIKHMGETVIELENNFKKRVDNLTESNEKLADHLSCIEEKVDNKVEEIKQLSKTLEELKSTQVNKLTEIDKIMDSFHSNSDNVDDRLLSLETNYNSLDKELNDKLSYTESKMKLENDYKNAEFNATINSLWVNSESAMGKINELRGSFEFFSSTLKSFNVEMSEMKSQIRQNEIELKRNRERCVNRERSFEENLDKSLKFQDDMKKNLIPSVANVEKNLEVDRRKYDNLVQKVDGLSDNLKRQLEEGQERIKNKFKQSISKVKKEVKDHEKSINGLGTDFKGNMQEIIRVKDSIFQNMHQELRTRTSVMEGSRSKNNDESGGGLLATVGGVVGGVYGGPAGAIAGKALGSVAGNIL